MIAPLWWTAPGQSTLLPADDLAHARWGLGQVLAPQPISCSRWCSVCLNGRNGRRSAATPRLRRLCGLAGWPPTTPSSKRRRQV